MQASAGLLTYFLILNQFGIKPDSLVDLVNVKAPLPNPGDTFDPNAPNLGNTNLGSSKEIKLDWNGISDNKVDIRLFYAGVRNESAWTSCQWVDHEKLSKGCYTTEALRYAQTGFLVSLVCLKMVVLVICKSGVYSLQQQGMRNSPLNSSLLFMITIVGLCVYLPELGEVLGTRSLPLSLLGVPSFSFCALIFA